MSELYKYAKALEDGSIDGISSTLGFNSLPYVVLRYMGAGVGEDENEDPGIENPDWYSVAWVSLLHMLPDAKIVEIIKQPTFPALADFVKFFTVTEEIGAFLESHNFVGMFVGANMDNDIALFLNNE